MQGHLPWLAAQGHVQMAFEYLHSWRLHSLSGQPVPMPSHPYSQKVLPDVLTEPPVFHFMPFLLSLGTNENSPPLASLHLSSGIYIHWWDPTQPSFLQTKQSQVSQPFCVGEMLHHLSIPLFDSWTDACLPWGTQGWTQHCRCGLSSNEQRGKDHLLQAQLMIQSSIMFLFRLWTTVLFKKNLKSGWNFHYAYWIHWHIMIKI